MVSANYAPGNSRALADLLFDFDFAAIIVTAFGTDVVGAFEFAAISAFRIIRPFQSMVRPAHVAPRRACFSFRDRHRPPLLIAETSAGFFPKAPNDPKPNLAKSKGRIE